MNIVETNCGDILGLLNKMLTVEQIDKFALAALGGLSYHTEKKS